MKRRVKRWGPILRSGLFFALVLSARVTPAQAGITVGLQPANQTVTPGSDFDLYIAVTQKGSAFNAFDAVVGYDPAALTLIELAPLSLQEGSLMKTACSNTFHTVTPGVDHYTVSDVLLCSDVSVTGPGQIYRVRFHASNTPQVTMVHLLPGLKFYNAGLYVTPVVSSDATVGIGVAVDVENELPVTTGLRVRAQPNPARSGTSVFIEAGQPGRQEVLVLDTLGRVVRHLQSGVFDRGRRTVTWDARSDSGRRVSAGVYHVLLRTATGSTRGSITLLE